MTNLSKTKIKILKTAQLLFNKDGVDSITVRHIASEMGISHGNLCYHYPSKNDIIKVLYFSMQKDVDKIYTNLDLSKNGIEAGIKQLHQLFDIVYNYRFIVNNNFEIFKRIPEIKKDYIENISKRKQSLRNVIEGLVKEKLIKKNIPEDRLELLETQISLISDFWIPYSDYAFKGNKTQNKAYFVSLFTNTLLPYLSLKGKIQLSRLVKK